MDGKNLKPVYEIFLSVPRMSDLMGLSGKISLKNLLLLVQVLQAALAKDDRMLASLHEVLTKEEVAELNSVGEELLRKADLTELNEKIRAYGLK